MKIKHWAGYGCVEGKKIRDVKLVSGAPIRRCEVEIAGNHERGLEPRYFGMTDWDRWIGKRFIRRPHKITSVKTEVFYDRVNGLDVETMRVAIDYEEV